MVLYNRVSKSPISDINSSMSIWNGSIGINGNTLYLPPLKTKEKFYTFAIWKK